MSGYSDGAFDGTSAPRRPAQIATPNDLLMLRLQIDELNAAYAAALDEGLNDKSFIVPGLGDFGDRLFGTG